MNSFLQRTVITIRLKKGTKQKPQRFLLLGEKFLFDGERFCAVGYLAAKAGFPLETIERMPSSPNNTALFEGTFVGRAGKFYSQLAEKYHTTVAILQTLTEQNDKGDREYVEKKLRGFRVLDEKTRVSFESEDVVESCPERYW